MCTTDVRVRTHKQRPEGGIVPWCGFQTWTAETQPCQGQARPGLGGVTRSELLAHPAAIWCYLRSAWLDCGNKEKPPENTRAEF